MTRQEENRELLKLFAPLRVADVRDGMDWMGYHFYGTLDKNIRPLWRTRICGIARTARYLPFEGPTPLLRGEEYTQWSNWYYNNVATYPWIEEIEDGDVIVLDMSGVDVGLMGSDNTLACVAKVDCDVILGVNMPMLIETIQQLEIAEDGIIDERERPEFDAIVADLNKTIAAAYQVIYADGAKKERPEAATSRRSVQGLASENNCKSILTQPGRNASPSFNREGVTRP